MVGDDSRDSCGVSVLEAIRNRRTVRGFLDNPVPREALERLIEAATWAPNHRTTEPWRFFALERGGETREKVARLVRGWTLETIQNPNVETRQKSAEKAAREVLDSPAFLYVYSVPGLNEEITRENYAATCCAVMNLSLAAYAEGLGVGWSTGKSTKPESLASTLGADSSWEMVGALFIGYPTSVPEAKRSNLAHCTQWL